MSVPRHDPLLSPLVKAFAVVETACCDVTIAPACELRNKLPISCAMVVVCWLLPSGTTNNEASMIIRMLPNKTPGSTKRRLCGVDVCGEEVRTRLIEAGMTIGTLTLVYCVVSGAVEIVEGNLSVVFGVSLPPVNG